MKSLSIILLSLSNWFMVYIPLVSSSSSSSSINPTFQSSLLSTSKCSLSQLESYDLDIAKLMTVGYRKWPENFQDSKPFCAETRRLSDRINTFKTRCPSGTAKEFTSVIIYSLQRTMKTYCPKHSTRKVLNFLKTKPCTNRVFNQTAKCLNRYIDQLQGITKAPVKYQLPHTCCQYYELLKCFENSYQKLSNCGDAAETFTNFVRQIFDDIINLTCQEYTEHSDRCEQLGQPPVKDPKVKRTKSFLLPLIDIWDKLDGNTNNAADASPNKPRGH